MFLVVLVVGLIFATINFLPNFLLSRSPEGVKIGKIKTNLVSTVKLEEIKLWNVHHQNKKVAEAEELQVDFDLLKIIRRKSIVSSIKTINVSGGTLKVERDKDGRWNFEDLLPPEKKWRRKIDFEGEIVIKKCQIIFQDNFRQVPPFLEHFREVEGKIDFSFPPLILFKIIDKDKRVISGHYCVIRKDLKVNINLKSQPLAKLQKYLYKQDILQVKAGEVDLNLNLGISNSKFYLFGDASVARGEIVVSDIKVPLRNVFTKVQFTDKDILFKNINFTLGKGEVRASGIVQLSSSPKMYFKGVAQNVSTQLFGKYAAGISSTVFSQFIVSGDISHPEIVGEIVAPEISWGEFSMSSVYSRIKYSEGELLLSDFKGETISGEVEGDGVFNIPENRAMLDIKIEGINFGTLKIPLSGDTGKSVSLSEAYIIAHLNDVSYNDIKFTDGMIVAEYKQNNLQIKAGVLKNKEAEVYLSGEFSPEDMHLIVEGNKIEIGDFPYLYPSGEYKGLLSFSGEVSGMVSSPSFSGEVNLQDASIKKQKDDPAFNFDKIQGDITISPHVFKTEYLTVKKDEASFLAWGEINYGEKKEIDLKIKGKDIDLGKLRNFNQINPVRDLSLNGVKTNLKVDVEVRGTLDNIWSKGSVEVLSSEVLGNEVKGGKINFIQTRDNIELDDAYLLLGDSIFNIKGGANIKNKILNIDFSSSKFHLKDIKFLQEKYNYLQGELSCQGKIEGEFSSPSLSVLLDGKNIFLDEGKIDEAQVNLSIREDFLSARGKVVAGEGNITSDMNLHFKDKDKYFLEIFSNFEDIEAKNIFSLLKIPSYEINTFVSGRVIVGGNIERDDKIKFESHWGEIDIVAENTTISGNVIEKITLQSLIDKDKLQIKKIEITEKDGVITGEGVVNFHGENDLHLEGSLVEVSWLNIFLPQADFISGKVNFSARIKGSIKEPEFLVNVEGNNIMFLGQTLDALRGNFNMQNSTLTLRNFFAEKNNQRILVEATLPFSWKEKKIPEGKELSVDVFTYGANLVLLTEVIEEVNFASGEITVKVSLRGTKEKQLLSGSIVVEKGEVDFFFLQDTIKDISFVINLVDDKVVIEKMEGRIKGGTFKVVSEMKIRDFKIEDMTVTLSAKNLPLETPPDFYGVVSGDLTYEKKSASQRLRGEVLLANASYTMKVPTEGRMLPESFISEIDYDLNLRLGENVWIRNNNLRAESKGTLRIFGKINEPVILGELTSARGTISYFDSIFKIEKIQIFFPTLYSFEPRIIAAAKTQVKIVEDKIIYFIPVILKLQGDASYLQVDVEYDDREYFLKTGKQLTKKDIISYLAYKQRIDDALRGDIVEVLQEGARGFFEASLMTQVISPMEVQIEKTLGLDDFSIDYGREKDYKLHLGKYIQRDLYLTYARSFVKGGSEKFKIEHYFLRGMSLFYEREKMNNISFYKLGALVRYRI